MWSDCLSHRWSLTKIVRMQIAASGPSLSTVLLCRSRTTDFPNVLCVLILYYPHIFPSRSPLHIVRRMHHYITIHSIDYYWADPGKACTPEMSGSYRLFIAFSTNHPPPAPSDPSKHLPSSIILRTISGTSLLWSTNPIVARIVMGSMVFSMLFATHLTRSPSQCCVSRSS